MDHYLLTSSSSIILLPKSTFTGCNFWLIWELNVMKMLKANRFNNFFFLIQHIYGLKIKYYTDTSLFFKRIQFLESNGNVTT